MKKTCMALSFLALLVLVSQSSAVLTAAPLPGAIFTTVADGTVVNGNTLYSSKCAVYLDGGPGPNAPAKAAGLPAGDYFFQVTDPSGLTLLSTDVVSNRRFHVSADGVITSYNGIGGAPHPTGVDQDHPELGAVTIGLANIDCPGDYLDTPNGGGVYKAWVTPTTAFVGDPTKVDNPCGKGCSHGFLAANSKTDNFKVQPITRTFCLSVSKQIVDPSGIFSGPGWPISVTDTNGVTNNYFTDDANGVLTVCSLVAGTYTVAEDPSGLQVAGLIVNGISLPVDTVYTFTWAPGQTPPSIVFQNQSPPPE